MESDNISARERLLEAGLEVFGRHGYESSTTRAIAREAGVNIAAIPYYYNGKEGLYLAVVAHVAGRIEDRLADPLGRIAARSALSSQEAADFLEQLLGALIDFMVGSSQGIRFARILLREQLFPTSAYDILFSRVMAPLIDAIARLVALASGTPESRALRMRALSMIGQVMAFRVARETMVRALNLKGYSPEETEEIRRIVLEQTRFVIRGMTVGEGGAGTP
jgi:TetR/AcrR family transcriptional regulator, regulator of cefoperazone and chloramphenicol sensitivity